MSTHPSEIPVVVRVLAQGRVFYAAPQALFEEIGEPAYQGFGKWRRDTYRPASLAQLMHIQADMRLFVKLPDDSLQFADLSLAELDADPFGLAALLQSGESALREYFPATQEYQVIPPTPGPRRQLLEQMEEALFGS